MTFRDVAYKNLKAHLRKYQSYFLCSSFSVMIFFMYMTLVFNKRISDYLVQNKADMIIPMAVTVITVFSVFFTNYSHYSFIKSRSGEFGLYLTLGMGKRDIGRLILVENALIASLSTAAGLLSGMVFSRLFFLAVVKFLNIPDVSFVLDYRQFAATVLTFAAIFSCVVLISRRNIRRLEISELLRQERKIPQERFSRPVWSITGLLLLIVYLAGIMCYSAAGSRNLFLMEGLMATGLIGVFLLMSNLGKLLLNLIRKNRTMYYKRILGYSEINLKFNQSKKVVFIISLLSAVLVCMVSMPVSVYPQMKDIAEKVLFSDLEFMELGDINRISAGELNSLLKNSRTPVKSHSRLEFVNLYIIDGSTMTNKLAVSSSQLLYAVGLDISVPEGAAVNLRYNTYSGRPISPRRQFELVLEGRTYPMALQGEYESNLVSMKGCPADSVLVLGDGSYEELKKAAGEADIGTIHLIDVQDWHLVNDAEQKLTNFFKRSGNSTAAAYYQVESRNQFYEGAKGIYAMFLFVTSFTAILFLIASVCVLYFKHYTELEETRRKYRKLYKLGIRRREAMILVTPELKLTYFLPVAIGFIIGYPMLYAASGIFMDFYHAGSLRGSIMRNALLAIGVYFLLQAVFYLITKARFTRQVVGEG